MEQRIQTKLKLTFWVNIFVLIAITIGLMYINGPVWGEGIEPNIIFARYAIVITLVCIPLALKLFHSQIKKNQTSDEDKYLD